LTSFFASLVSRTISFPYLFTLSLCSFVAGSSIRQFLALTEKFRRESREYFTDWIHFEAIKELMPEDDDSSFFSDQHSSFMDFSFNEEQDITENPISPLEDPDKLFIIHMLHEVKQLDPFTRSVFKHKTQSLIHELKFGNREV
jgi:DNA-binding MltR family transcriptional regulator